MLVFAPFWDSQRALFLVENGMRKTPPDLTDLSVQVQAYVATQAVELADLKQEFLGLSLSRGPGQKRLKDEMEAAIAAKRAAHAGLSRAEIPSLTICAHGCTGLKRTALAPSQTAAHNWHWN